MTDNEGKLSFYREADEKAQIKYREQAKYLRDELDITTVDKAVEFMRSWLPTQTFNQGIMKGNCASVMLTCAILGQAIEPNDERRIAFSEATVGVDVYYSLKEENLW